jgi:hypothetical protein
MAGRRGRRADGAACGACVHGAGGAVQEGDGRGTGGVGGAVRGGKGIKRLRIALVFCAPVEPGPPVDVALRERGPGLRPGAGDGCEHAPSADLCSFPLRRLN